MINPSYTALSPPLAPPVEAVGGILYRRRHSKLEVLLIKKQGGFWTLPKGQVEAGESHSQALVREMQEETGIIGVARQQVCTVQYLILKAGVPRTKVVTYYLMRGKRGRLRPNKKEKIARAKWFPVAEALLRIKRARVRTIVQKAAEMLDA